MAEGTNLAERGREKISAAAAIELAKKFAKDRYKADLSNSDHALAEARSFAGGQVERLDKDVIDQGRQWATRLALVSRTTAGNGYQASKASASVAGACKKVFAIIGELEALVATDTEISLFQKVDKDDYFGGYGRDDFKRLSVADLTEGREPGDALEHADIVDQIHDMAGNRIAGDLLEYLNQYEIEPIVIPAEPEGEKPANGRRRRRS